MDGRQRAEVGELHRRVCGIVPDAWDSAVSRTLVRAAGIHIPENDTILVSYRFWRNQLGSDPHVIGRVVHFEDESQTIVGVLPPVLSELFPDTDVWPKLTTNPSWPYM